MKIVNLYHHLRHDMSATSSTLKKGQDRPVSACYLRPQEKSIYRAQCFFFIESEKCLEKGGCGYCLLPQTFGKVELQGAMFFFIESESMSGILRTCQWQCPPLVSGCLYRTVNLRKFKNHHEFVKMLTKSAESDVLPDQNGLNVQYCVPWIGIKVILFTDKCLKSV